MKQYVLVVDIALIQLVVLFFLEEDYGRARVIAQDGDQEELVQEAIDTCPVDCIAWVNYNDLNKLEEARKYQVIQNLGIIGDGGALRRSIKSQN